MVSSRVSTTAYSAYDEIGDVTASSQTTNGQTYPFTYSYNLLGGTTQAVYPSGRTVNTVYDGAGRAVCVTAQSASTCATNPSATYVNNAVYAANGQVSTLPYGSGLTATTTFNTRFQPAQIQAGTLLTLSYGYGASNNNGNVQSATTTRGNQTWTLGSPAYDGVNRLTGATETGPGTGWQESYGYDAAGNRWVAGSSFTLTQETPQAGQWYTSSANRIPAWSYDRAGNVTQVAGMSRAFTYDLENRQKTSAVNGWIARFPVVVNVKPVTTGGVRSIPNEALLLASM